MKVRELIELLQTMPQDAEVIYSYHSEMTILNPDEVKLYPAEARKYHRTQPGSETFMRFVEHWHKGGEPLPQFEDVVVFLDN